MFVAVLVVVALGALPMADARPDQNGSRVSFQRLFDAYEAGDHDVVTRTIRTATDLEAVLLDYQRAVTAWQARWAGRGPNWRRVQPAFALEMAALAVLNEWSGAAPLFYTVGRLTVQRPARIGDEPEEDAFEVLVHRAAVALAQAARAPAALETYARFYDGRIGADTPRLGRRIVDPRFLLSAAIGVDQRAVVNAVYLDEAARKYRAAARYKVNAAEASVRLAWVLHRRGRFADGLAALDELDPSAAHPEVIYLGHLFRGRLLASLDRPEDAAKAYAEALEVSPLAQAPAVGLAALHLLNDRRDLSLEWARVARTQSPGDLDPWWRYARGEGRWFLERLNEVRQAIR
jgi:tetratricopeptide (TPR) repeat protein